MPKLSFVDVVEQWRRVNRTVAARAFVAALWTYCRSQQVFRWKNLFMSDREVEKVAGYFYDERGYVWARDGKKVKRYYDLTSMLTPYFFNLYSQECAFIASLMLKFFDLMYPNLRNVGLEEILGRRGARASHNFVSTSKWCQGLEIADFDEDYSGDEEENTVDTID